MSVKNAKLAWCLAKVLNMAFSSESINFICDFVQINSTFIRKVVEDIMRRLGLFSSLFVAEDEINPMVQIVRYIV